MRRWMFFSVLASFSSIVLALPAIGAENSTLVKAEDLINQADGDTVLIVDVREAAAYQAGHIPSAVSFVKDNIAFLSVREVAEAFGASIEWDGTNKQITVFLP